jgi:hypothetical protein
MTGTVSTCVILVGPQALWKEESMDVTGAIELTDEQRKEVSRIWGSAPAIALPHGGMTRRPESVKELINGFASVVEFLKAEMAKESTAQAELDKVNSELATVGRLLTRLGLGEVQQQQQQSTHPL